MSCIVSFRVKSRNEIFKYSGEDFINFSILSSNLNDKLLDKATAILGYERSLQYHKFFDAEGFSQLYRLIRVVSGDST